MKKNLLILAAFALLLLLMSQTYKSRDTSTICNISRSSYEAKKYIESKSTEGYRVVSVTSFAEGSTDKTYNAFLIVMEKR